MQDQSQQSVASDRTILIPTIKRKDKRMKEIFIKNRGKVRARNRMNNNT
jgi:hypothetical protein